MCLIPKHRDDEPSSYGGESGLLDLLFTCLDHYHQYKATGAVEDGIEVREEGGVVKFQYNGSFTGNAE